MSIRKLTEEQVLYLREKREVYDYLVSLRKKVTLIGLAESFNTSSGKIQLIVYKDKKPKSLTDKQIDKIKELFELGKKLDIKIKEVSFRALAKELNVTVESIRRASEYKHYADIE